jgi:Flp pilus assembly protein TadG
MHWVSRALRRRNERGASAVEFAFVVPFLLVLVFGMIQYGWYFYSMQRGTSATSDVVRRMSVGDCQTAVQQENLLTTRLGGAMRSGSPLTVDANYTSAAAGHAAVAAPGEVGGGVELVVTFQTDDFNFPFIPVPDDGEVTRRVFARVEDTTPTGGGCS